MQQGSSQGSGIGRWFTVAIASILFASTMILSAVGPARAGELPPIPCHSDFAVLRYLA